MTPSEQMDSMRRLDMYRLTVEKIHHFSKNSWQKNTRSLQGEIDKIKLLIQDLEERLNEENLVQ